MYDQLDAQNDELLVEAVAERQRALEPERARQRAEREREARETMERMKHQQREAQRRARLAEEALPPDLRLVRWTMRHVSQPYRIKRFVLWLLGLYEQVRMFALAAAGGRVGEAEYQEREAACRDCPAQIVRRGRRYCGACNCLQWQTPTIGFAVALIGAGAATGFRWALIVPALGVVGSLLARHLSPLERKNRLRKHRCPQGRHPSTIYPDWMGFPKGGNGAGKTMVMSRGGCNSRRVRNEAGAGEVPARTEGA